MNNTVKPKWTNKIHNALQQNASSPESRYVQMATVDSQGRPAVRTLVFRDFVENTTTMIMHTDLRSHKTAEIAHQPRVQVCWYFSQSREQFRLDGSIEIVSHAPNNSKSAADDWQQLRKAHWHRLSAPAKASYCWAAPGSIYSCNIQPDVQSQTNQTSNGISQHFALLLIAVDKVDHLQLIHSPHQRHLYSLEHGQWNHSRINP